MFQTIVKIFLLVIITAAITPFIRKLAFVLGAVDNPNARRINKKPMPTIGGLAIFVAFNIGEFVLLRKDFPTHELFSVLLASSVIILTGLIDDILELKPRQKMFGIFVASLVVYFLAGIKVRELSLPFLGHIQLGWWSFPLTIFWILALTNAVNLIDGLDGLAGGLSALAFMAYGVIAWGTTWLSGYQDIAIFSFVLVGSLIGFLFFNAYPAKVFMGDTGSLALGAALATIAILTRHEMSLILIGGVFVVETLSSLIQIIAIRKFHTKVFKKAPLHHHFEELGWTETDIVIIFWTAGFLLSMIGIIYGVWL